MSMPDAAQRDQVRLHRGGDINHSPSTVSCGEGEWKELSPWAHASDPPWSLFLPKHANALSGIWVFADEIPDA